MKIFLQFANMLSRFKLSYPKLIGTAIALLAAVTPAYSLTPETFATSSKLSSGNWAKIEVQESGMQFISNATLKNLGFSDPDKVNVYGFGGRMLDERLYDSMPDDLPLLPSVRTPGGIVFFGHGCFKWELSSSATNAYKHTNNPYSDHSYYFVSDIDPARPTVDDRDAVEISDGLTLRSFKERLVHEQDLLAPTNSGRTLLGEDFRTQKKRTFQFDLPGNMGDAIFTVSFGAYTTNGSSSLIFTANNEQLPTTASDVIAAVSGDKTLYILKTMVKSVEDPGEKLNLTIDYSTQGTLFTAALDYIEVEYERELKLRNDELYFYLNPPVSTKVEVGNCNESTVIWDVTDPINPVNVKYTLSGNVASFATPKGMREYVAFNPLKTTRQVAAAGKVSNQNLHGMEAPEMLIITPEAFRSAAQKLADLHASTDGLKVAIVTPEAIYNEFSSGVADITAFRKLLKMWYDRGMEQDGNYPRYCLLMGRPSYDNKMVTPTVKNAGYPRMPIWQSPATTTITKSSSYSTDDYIGMLADQPSSLNIGSLKIQVAVGRMPVKSLQEANTAVAKLEKYMKRPVYGSWRNNVMLIADDQDNGKHLAQAENVYEALRSGGNGADFLYEKLYLDSYTLSYGATGAIYPEAKQKLFDKLAEGVSYINYIGHANPRSWTHESLVTWSDLTSMTNTNLPFIYAATCEFMRWDSDDVSGGELLWLYPDTGVIGMICPSREVLIEQNGAQNARTAKYMYSRNEDGTPLRVGDVMINGKNDSDNHTNKLKYGLIGDPSLRVLSPGHSVSVLSIKGTDVDQIEDMPVIAARSSFDLTGMVTDFDGNLIEDFNGIVEIQLYDAEIVITTNGNGKEGKVDTYNDRKTRLYTGRARVTNGMWSLTVNMPSEIENNYSPALISLYAYDETGREANGSFEKFYVYGFDENAPDDFDGPSVKEFYLNSSDFADGAPVSPSPILYASFSDPSGINVSDSGLGHQMILTLDNGTYFNDVNLYFSPDADDHLSGSIAYPLQGIAPGEHTLKLTVWDNANNSTSKELTFYVSASWLPEITTLTTDVNPATTSVNFLVSTDGANGIMDCTIEVYDLNGKRVWSGNAPSLSASGTSVSLGWDLCYTNGGRVNRGIYLYRAIVTTPEGATIMKTNKLAVAKQ